MNSLLQCTESEEEEAAGHKDGGNKESSASKSTNKSISTNQDRNTMSLPVCRSSCEGSVREYRGSRYHPSLFSHTAIISHTAIERMCFQSSFQRFSTTDKDKEKEAETTTSCLIQINASES